jgi:hypothetical protein
LRGITGLTAGDALAINAGAALVYSTRVLDAVRNHPTAPSPQNG